MFFDKAQDPNGLCNCITYPCECEPILGPPVLACGPGEKLVRLDDGGQACVPDDIRPYEPLCGPGQVAVQLSNGDWACRSTTTPPVVIPPPPGTKVCPDGSVVIASGPCPQTITPGGGGTGGGTPVPGTDPLMPGDDDPPGIFATLMGEDGTNIFGIKPIYAIGAAVAAFFLLGGSKK